MLTDKQKEQILLAQYYGAFGTKAFFEEFLKKCNKFESSQQKNENLHKRYAKAFGVDLMELRDFLDVHQQAFQMVNSARCAGFGGWGKYVPSDEEAFQKYKRELPGQEQTELNKKCARGFVDFIQWYQNKHKLGEKTTCCYFGISEELCSQLIPYHSTRGGKRAQHLEIERLDSGKNIYTNTNCSLACYVCNNAKSNIFTVKEFRPIAFAINQWWNDKLEHSNLKGKYPKIEFPTDIWLK